MDQLQNMKVFKGEFGEIRTVLVDDEVWFVGKDVATALGYKNTKDALNRHVDEDDKRGAQNTTPYIIDSMGRKQYPVFINESGLYSLVLSSKLESAKKFKRWITSEVIPSIRKNGGYIANQEKMTPEQIVANALVVAQNIINNQTKKIEEMKPKALFADAVSTSNTSILVGDLAKLIKQNGVNIGQKRLFEWLRENGYLIKRKGADWNSPTQRSMETGLFEIKETVISHSDGHTTISKTTKVTGKGQQYFVNKFLGGMN